MSANVYLGCNQREVQPELQWRNEENDLFKKLKTHATAEGDPCEQKKSDQGKDKNQVQKHPNAGNEYLAGDDAGEPCEYYPAADITKTRAWNYDMIGHAEQCVQRWCELANKGIKDIPVVSTPCIDDHNLRPEDFVDQGTLSHV